jgi:hypothetical protein
MRDAISKKQSRNKLETPGDTARASLRAPIVTTLWHALQCSARGDRRRGQVAAALLAVAMAVSAASAAQMESGRRWETAIARLPPADRTSSAVVQTSPADTMWDGPGALPPNIAIADSLRSTVRLMLHASPTFRRQCLRIANAPRLTVMFDLVQLLPQQMRARTRVSTTRDGSTVAKVEIGHIEHAVELIAHEIEHVIEQLDEVDLPALAAVPESGVHDCGDRSFETIRATRAGRIVAAEVKRHFT